MTNRPDATRTLHAAAYAGDLEAVRRYVAEGDDLEAIEEGLNSNGRTVLGIAAHEGYSEIVRLLLTQGANPKAPGQHGTVPLQEALWSANPEILRMLLNHGAEVYATDENGSHALIELAWITASQVQRQRGMIARLRISAGDDVDHVNFSTMNPPAEASNRAFVRILVEAGVVIDAMEDDRTPLWSALQKQNFDEVRLLVELGANVNQADADGDTAWNWALRWGYTEIATLLEQAGAVEPIEVERDLHQAILWGKTEAVASLLKRGGDANAPNRNGQTPLFAAIEYWGKEANVRLLLDYGAEVCYVGDYGQTALMSAVETGKSRQDRRAIVELLIERGADINAAQLDKSTALLKTHAGDTEITRLLLKAGAEVNAGDWEGRTVLMDAAGGGNIEIVALLLMHNADVNARTATIPNTGYYGGHTPLLSAVRRGYREVVCLLLDHGADLDAQDDSGFSALLWAMMIPPGVSPEELQNMVAMVKLLLERGANVNLRDIYGYTALDRALNADRSEIIQLLERAGATCGESQGLSFCIEAISDDSDEPDGDTRYFLIDSTEGLQEEAEG